ncbi:uncharacterized protein LOC142463029 [Ascaphus truei]|uniref:uncharacterized protein LOC142463029 n=1 Tax=Ascaphus truei TaxID=8439 RepID=UPI003F59A13C
MDIDQLKEYTINFSLDNCTFGNQGYNRVLLQLFGYLGHGKSSFINSCKYVLEEGEFRIYADAGHSDGGKTTRRITYPLTDTITVVDNRGCATMNSYETGEIFAQLGNLLPLDQEVVWDTGYQSIMHRLVEGDMDANYSDFVVPIFVYSVKTGIARQEVPVIKDLLDNARKLTGLDPIVVLTYKSQGDLTGIQAKFKNMGTEHIFQLENFTSSDHLRTRARSQEILTFCHEVLKNVEFRMRERRNPQRERAERKKFVLEFAHEREMKREMEKKEQEMAAQQAERERKRAHDRKNESSCLLQ